VVSIDLPVSHEGAEVAYRVNVQTELQYLLTFLLALLESDILVSIHPSHPKEGALQIFIALKTALPQPCLNPCPLGPVASTLTTTPPWLLKGLQIPIKYSGTGCHCI
jgi:hypothetical protein